MLALLAIAAAHAQDVAGSTSLPDTGTMLGGSAVAVVIIRELLAVIGKLADRQPEPKPDVENAAIAAIDARLKSAETTVSQLGRRADTAQTDRARHDERIAALRSDLDAHRQQTATERAADRAETAQRLDRIADAIDSRR